MLINFETDMQDHQLRLHTMSSQLLVNTGLSRMLGREGDRDMFVCHEASQHMPMNRYFLLNITVRFARELIRLSVSFVVRNRSK